MFVWTDKITKGFEALKLNYADDFVDRINYIYTVTVLLFLAVFVGAKQHFGTPIQCMAPAHFPGTWVAYVQDYCFVSNTYMVNESSMTTGTALMTMKQEIAYYQWVPYILLLQALLCALPKIIWNVIVNAQDFDFQTVLSGTSKLPSVTNEKERHEHLKRIARFVVAYLKFLQARRSFFFGITGYSASFFYVIIKWSYFGVCFAQLYSINTAIGDGSWLWGYQLMDEIIEGRSWESLKVFPRVTFCDVDITELGEMNTYSMQCVLMTNIVNEKIYLALWHWLALLSLVNLISALSQTVALFCPYMRYTRVLNSLQVTEKHLQAGEKRCLLGFVGDFLKPDGVLLLSFVSSHAGGLVAGDLLREMWILNNGCGRSECPERFCEEFDMDDEPKDSSENLQKGFNAFGMAKK